MYLPVICINTSILNQIANASLNLVKPQNFTVSHSRNSVHKYSLYLIREIIVFLLYVFMNNLKFLAGTFY
jgi:hypothetical protein